MCGRLPRPGSLASGSGETPGCSPISSLPRLTPYPSEAPNPREQRVPVLQCPRADAEAFLDPAIHSQAAPPSPWKLLMKNNKDANYRNQIKKKKGSKTPELVADQEKVQK